jgi:hypothetical protein
MLSLDVAKWRTILGAARTERHHVLETAMREFLSKRQRRATTIAIIAGAVIVAVALTWTVVDERHASACTRWRVDYKSAFEDTSQAIDSGDTDATGPTFERLYRLDRARPDGCPLPVDSNLREPCLRCGHQ